MDAASEFLSIATSTARAISDSSPEANPGSRLFWAAVNLAGTLTAVALIDLLATRPGLDRLREVLGVESHDVLEAMAVGIAARGAVSAMDLCAATAWRIQPGTRRGDEWEPDLACVAGKSDSLHPNHRTWVEAVTGSTDWRLLSDCRDRATHRTFRRDVMLAAGGANLPYDAFEIAGTPYPADVLVRRFAQRGEEWFRDFCRMFLRP